LFHDLWHFTYLILYGNFYIKNRKEKEKENKLGSEMTSMQEKVQF
jgi:hypothetical protein